MATNQYYGMLMQALNVVVTFYIEIKEIFSTKI
jgi:hypothetical protein